MGLNATLAELALQRCLSQYCSWSRRALRLSNPLRSSFIGDIRYQQSSTLMQGKRMFEDTNPRDLKQLLAQIHTRECALPEFQRNFVWDPGATKELIVSIAKGFPAGSLLRIRNSDGSDLFEYRQFEGAPALNGHRPTYLVLDGQQRLTSLYQAFYGVGEYKYFVNLQKLLGGEEFDECIFSLNPNPPKDSGRGVRELQGDILGSIGADGRFGGRSAGAFGGADGGLQWL